jgi:hypothetical protein
MGIKLFSDANVFAMSLTKPHYLREKLVKVQLLDIHGQPV